MNSSIIINSIEIDLNQLPPTTLCTDIEGASFNKNLLVVEKTIRLLVSGFRPQQGYVLQIQCAVAIQVVEAQTSLAYISATGNILVSADRDLSSDRLLQFQISASHQTFNLEIRVIAIPSPKVARGDGRWDRFNIQLFKRRAGIPEPHHGVDRFIHYHLPMLAAKNPSLLGARALDLGCETGKHANLLIKQGIKLDLLDISSRALEFTVLNLADAGRLSGIRSLFAIPATELPAKAEPYRIIVASYVFPFNPPELFETAIRNVWAHLETDGFFVAGFFGKNHDWREKSDLTFNSEEELRTLFKKNSMVILDFREVEKDVMTAFDGIQNFHTFDVIAKKC